MIAENKAFLKEQRLKIKDVAAFFSMSEDSLRNSTAKDRYITAIRRYDEYKNSKCEDKSE